ncbi:hypothetical protein K450DRAFT_245598 [Umbelopsis ramanniana AG]|uniref:RRM domain-containing protein n=1 Tax=Umbelopsis ramanniana AG TaxID=1314678 RepID=A0AAD5E7C9_UMBRA|nr:uncharacterized protein K450DRAFT_245598 [Umbelopsis ramanniana AG]KAI8578803.1 hypothetical protein K450DRAFT_245598 [Umbelopsis ramanniana AG]
MQEATNEAPIAADRPTESSCNSPSATTMKAYVGELDSNMGKSDLLPALNHLGKVSSFRISRDAITGASLGYGFVEYDPSHSVRPLREISINGKLVRVMWSLRQTQIVDEKEAVIYLANLDKSIGEKALRDTFSAFGSVTSCTLLSGCKSSGTAAITFDTHEAAKKAVKIINECLWNGEQIVASFERIEEHELPVTQIGKATVNENLNSRSDHHQEQTILPPEASSNASSWPDMATNRSKGSNIVNNVRKDGILDTSQNPDHECDGQKPKESSTADKDTGVHQTGDTFHRVSNHKTDTSEGKRELYIRNIDATLDERTIKKEFEVFVKVEQVRIVKQRKHDSPKTYGFVTVKSLQDANKLISEMSGKSLRSKTLHISFAHSNYQTDQSRNQ